MVTLARYMALAVLAFSLAACASSEPASIVSFPDGATVAV